jgi:Bacterial Ig-like domain
MREVRIGQGIGQALVLLALTGSMFLGYAGSASADTGYRDFSFSAPSVSNPTGEKPQSKLWFNDGTWWGSLFNRSTEAYHIYRYDRATHTWSDTGTALDDRNPSKADTLWDGTHLYVASATQSSTSGGSARLYRYSYDTATKRYTLNPGFPVNITGAGMEAIVLDKDSTGKLWVTYTQGSQVYVNRSLGNDQTWGTPFVLPVQGTTVSADDISGIVAFDTSTAAPQIGVMWSNQIDSAMYFATHRDGDADDIWQASRTAIQGPNLSDDHISLRSLQADDVSGRVFAAVKTSLNDVPNPNPNAPLNFLLVRGQDGSWTNNVFGRVSDNHTRPIVMIDQEHRDLYMFATAPQNAGTIYYKKSPLGNISFPTGRGTPFIQSTTDTLINNATSTKQNINSTTGLLVQASDDTSKNYLHNFMDLGDADTSAPTISTVAPADEATGVAATSNVEATFSEAMNPATISGSTFTLTKLGDTQTLTAQVSYDAPTKKATLDPNAELDPSTTYTATIKGGTSGVKDLAGNPLAQDKSWSFTSAALPQDTIPPETVIDSGPSETVTSRTASFTFSSSEANSTFECKLDDANFVPCTSPQDYSELADGPHTFEVKAKDGAGNVDATPASRTFSVEVPPPPPSDTTPPETTIDSGPSGTVSNSSASFEFSSSEAGSTFECRLDSTTFSSCTSPQQYSGLAEGSHTFEVRATDAAGNTDAIPASRTWTVATASASITITSTADAKIAESAPTTNYGKDKNIGVSGDEPTGSTKDVSALLKWNVSNIPAGSKISSVTVTLNITDSSTQTYEVYGLKRPWVESAATWNAYANKKPWEIAGARGSLDREAQAAGALTPSSTGKQTFDLSPTLVQSWLDNSASNNGIVIANAANTDGFAFSTRESTPSSLRPQITVTYSAP